jgi:serine/threonine protein kinase
MLNVFEFACLGDIETVFSNPHFRTMKNITKVYYVAQLVIALEYLHFIGVAYRDLELKHIFIDQRGYMKIIDYSSNPDTPTFLFQKILIKKNSFFGKKLLLLFFFEN